VRLAGLVRALNATAGRRRKRRPAEPPVSDDVLRAAHWNAARQGLDSTLLDPFNDTASARPGPGHRGHPALDRHGDRPLVDAELARLRAEGTGAPRRTPAPATCGRCWPTWRA
jgi:carboxylate-amine ligase